MSDGTNQRIVVNPKPDEREMAAIAAAVLTVSANRPEPDEKSQPNAWREAGKRESLRGNHRE